MFKGWYTIYIYISKNIWCNVYIYRTPAYLWISSYLYITIDHSHPLPFKVHGDRMKKCYNCFYGSMCCMFRHQFTNLSFQSRLCVWLILQLCPGDSLAVIATVCSSFSRMNVGTSRRSILLPEGWSELAYVRQANSMMSRTHP